MAAFAPHFHLLHRLPPLPHHRIPIFSLSFQRLSTSRLIRDRRCILRRGITGNARVICMCSTDSQLEDVAVEIQKEEVIRPPFDLNLAVILAGFAFEAYYTPPENIGKFEMDAAGCKTIFLSEPFVRNIYDGQLFVKLKRGLNFPAMDPWGTSDPYVVMQYGGQVVKSNIKWGKREPTWNEEFTLNIKQQSEEYLQVAAWDANLIAPHKRMGNSGVSLEGLCDGYSHELLVELEGIGGGGKIELEVRYRTFNEIDKDRNWWRVPYFISDFLRKNGFEPALKMLVGSDTVQTRDFVKYAFGQLKSFNDTYTLEDNLPSILKPDIEDSNKCDHPSDESNESPSPDESPKRHPDNMSSNDAEGREESQLTVATPSDNSMSVVALAGDAMKPSGHFWKSFTDVINRNVVQKLGVPVPENMTWDGFDLLDKIGLQFKSAAEAHYVESGLATPSKKDSDDDKVAELQLINTGGVQSNIQDVKKATEDLLRQTDSIFGALMVLAASVQRPEKESDGLGKSNSKNNLSSEVSSSESEEGLESNSLGGMNEKKDEEMKALFSSAESAMEAWAMLAMSSGHPSFIKSEFEKICFLDNSSTDTQVALWRDLKRKRLVVAFRGTEQTKWKDLITDLMLAPAGLNPERIGGDFKQEVQVHSGFLSAYDSVRTRVISLIKKAVSYMDNDPKAQRWHVYVTGHSLGGALATLLALELSSSHLAKSGAVTVTMYNFGSPRVGNRNFAEVYNQKVKDSWRIVNHRDIIPTVPRLMGYCHVAQPLYLAAGMLQNALENMELSGDGYRGDVIGESTPDVIVSEFMKGEKDFVEKLLQTEINIFRSIRDGSAFMQHMEDFYYIALLEYVRSRYQTSPVPGEREDGESIA